MTTLHVPSPQVIQALLNIHAKLQSLGDRLKSGELSRMAEEDGFGDEPYFEDEEPESLDPPKEPPQTSTSSPSIEKPLEIQDSSSLVGICVIQAIDQRRNPRISSNV